MFDIKKYFGRRGSEQKPTLSDSKIIKSMSLGGLRPDRPKTTTFNRNMVIALAGVFTVVFVIGLMYGMNDSSSKKKQAEDAGKNKMISTAPVNATQLDKLPSSYDKTKNGGISVANNTANLQNGKTQQQMSQPGQMGNSQPVAAASRPVTTYSSPPIPARQSYSYSYNEPPVAAPRPPVATIHPVSSSQPAGNNSVETAVAKAMERALQEQAEARKRELQEQADARKSSIRFNVK